MKRIELVTSALNPLVKDVRRAIASGGLTGEGCWVVEGFRLFDEALRTGLQIPVVLAAEFALPKIESHAFDLRAARVVALADAAFQSVAGTENSQGLIALVRPPEWSPNSSMERLFHGQTMLMVLDGVQDPGNAGTIVRAAEAFGATGVIFVKGTASPFNPKTLRASAGSLFRLPFAAALDRSALLASLKSQRLDAFAAVPFTGKERSPAEVDFRRRCAIMIGSEGAGVSSELRAAAENIAIQTNGVESLNAAMAASILLYEAHQQRARRTAEARA